MANLIITIISIALVAVAAIMGAYYGGVAFLEGQAKSRAVKVINDLTQLEAAIKFYGVNNAGTKIIPSAPFYNPVGGNWNVFIPTYMNSAPKPAELSGVMTDYMCIKLIGGAEGYDEAYSCSDVNGEPNDNAFLIAPVAEATCRAAARMANNGAFTSFYKIQDSGIPAMLGIGGAGERKYDCGILDDSSGAIIDGSTYYWLIYRWD